MEHPVLGNLSLALILGTAAAVQDDDDDNFTTLIKDPTSPRYSKDPWVQFYAKNVQIAQETNFVWLYAKKPVQWDKKFAHIVLCQPITEQFYF